MSKHINAADGFTLKDLLSEDGITLDVGDDYVGDEEEEEFPFSPNIHLTNSEMLQLLNMEEFLDDEPETEESAVTLCNISFDKLRLKMADIYENQKIMKLVKQNGVGDIVPPDAQVTVKYVGYFEYQDEPFDSTYARGRPEIFRLGQGNLIVGLEAALQTMKKHEISVFLLHPSFAYGPLGAPPRIPPNAEVLFIVHLIDYLDNGSADTYENLTVEERKQLPNVLQQVNAMLNTAKDSFQRKRYKQAIRQYKTVARWLENVELHNDEEEAQMNALLSKAYTNLAVCYNKDDQPRLACSSCIRVPVPTSKTHFNHGRAMIKLGEFEKAMKFLQSARKMEPNNKEIYREMHFANQKMKVYVDIERRLWANCLKNSQKKELTEFQKAAKEMCDAFARDPHNLRHPLPEALTAEEEKYIMEQAAAFGLSVTKHTRYGKETIYLNKPNY